ncbi:hypothetical protein [uncultured Sulfitobacter sp.]|jgi:hypothetical protein|uniref:hypothetical protein n=1 Tax=Sulfitobacter sp. SH22 TaxID=3421172 RepID=UPI0025EB2548|nr:hypothetical protein [uncultured Sulfitobacter sp.]
MKRAFAIIALLGLAACGADGEPTPPHVNTAVTLSTSGVSLGSSVSVGRGPFRLGLGLSS